MAVRVELFGIARQRAGLAAVELDADTLGQALAELGRRRPGFADACLDGERLRSGYIANVNGRNFTRDPASPLAPGDCVLVLSADSGG